MPDIVTRTGLEKIKFLDEVHFVSRSLNRTKGVGPKGKIITVETWTDLQETYSMTFLSNPSHHVPFNANIRKNSNTQFDFGLFIADCIVNQFIVGGDVIVLDNASVHVGADSFVTIVNTLKQIGVRLVFFRLLVRSSILWSTCFPRSNTISVLHETTLILYGWISCWL